MHACCHENPIKNAPPRTARTLEPEINNKTAKRTSESMRLGCGFSRNVLKACKCILADRVDATLNAKLPTRQPVENTVNADTRTHPDLWAYTGGGENTEAEEVYTKTGIYKHTWPTEAAESAKSTKQGTNGSVSARRKWHHAYHSGDNLSTT